MPKLTLTPKMERFAAAYFVTGNASEAYRQSYDARNCSPRTIEKRAAELLKHGAVAGRVDELRKQIVEKAIVTRDEVVRDLKLNSDIALGKLKARKTIRIGGEDGSKMADVEVYDRDPAAANAALKLLGQLPEVGLFDADGKTSVSVAIEGPQPVGEEWLRNVAERFRVAGTGAEPNPTATKAVKPAPGVDHLEELAHWSTRHQKRARNDDGR